MVLSCCHSSPMSPLSPLVAHRGWKLSNEVRSTLKGSSLPGLWILLPPSTPLLFTSRKPPRWNMDRSNLRHSLYDFIIFFLYPALEGDLKPVGKQSCWTINSQKRQWRFKIKTQMGDYHPYSCFWSISWHLESHLGYISIGLCLRSVWCANKEREGVQRKRVRVVDVLIKGNSEGLDQIILHNLVSWDTAFDTEKMEMTCPQRPIPTVRDQSVVAKAIHFNRGDDDESGMFMYRILCSSVWRPQH